MPNPKQILVTKNGANYPLLSKWAKENDITVIYQSLIETAPVLGKLIPTTDWIFFNSPNAVHIYLKNYAVLATKIGAFGKGTAKALRTYNLQSDFCGGPMANPSEIGRAFKNYIPENATVLFPISQRSKKSVLKELSPHQCFEINTYTTVLRPTEFRQKFNYILFTSPSNLESYLLKNELDKNSNAIALGITTGNALKSITENRIVLNAPTEEAFINYLQKKLGDSHQQQ